MVDSRLRNNPPTLFHCFAVVTSPKSEEGLQIQHLYPEEFSEKDLILKDIPGFSYPCDISSEGVEYSTFVLTDLDSKFRFGFCRYPSKAVNCLCVISYLPWFKTFYSLLDKISLTFGSVTNENKENVEQFLKIFNKQMIPDPGSKITMKFQSKIYEFTAPNTTTLPCIPENLNLTKYYAKIKPENMVSIFISMLFERRILVTSEKLSILTAIIHGSVTLLYPMQWQHIFVPVLPPHLTDYVCAPMPFLLGVHSSMMPKVRQMPMNEVVILDADRDEIELPDDGLESSFPKSVANKLIKRLKRSEKVSKDYVSNLFLEALADLVGGYRESMKLVQTDEGEKVVFDNDLFLTTRTGQRQLFLRSILELQSFRQFVLGRLDMMNDGVEFVDIFEKAIIKRNDDLAAETKFDAFKDRMKKGGGALKKTVGGKYGHLKGIASEIEVKEEVKEFRNKIKEKVVRRKKKKEKEAGIPTVKRNNSMPINQNVKMRVSQSRHATISENRNSMFTTINKRDTPKPGKTPPPRPPQPTRVLEDTNEESHSAKLNRKVISISQDSKMSLSRSDNNIAKHAIERNSFSSLDDLSTSSDSSDDEEGFGSYSNPAFKDSPDKKMQNQREFLFEASDRNASISEEVNLQFNEAMTEKPKESSLKRSTPVFQRKQREQPRIPPLKTPSDHKSLSPTLKTPPNRPPPPNLNKLIDTSSPDKSARTVDDIFADAIKKQGNASVKVTTKTNVESKQLMPNSPFYMPSSDLLGLDESLFTETVQSLSDDTRSFFINSDSPSRGMSPVTEKRHNNNPSMSETCHSKSHFKKDSSLDLSFDNSTPVVREGAAQSNQKIPLKRLAGRRRIEGNERKTDDFDPFASCVEEAKKDFTLSNKSKRLMSNRVHIFQTVSLPLNSKMNHNRHSGKKGDQLINDGHHKTNITGVKSYNGNSTGRDDNRRYQEDITGSLFFEGSE